MAQKTPGWHKKPYFVDDDGNVYHSGVLQVGLKAEPTAEITEEPKAEVKKETKMAEESTLSKAEIEAIRKENAEIKEMLKNMQKPQEKGGIGMSSMELAEAIATAQSLQSGRHTYATSTSIDPSDYDAKGVKFICRKMGYYITCDMRGNYASKPPLNNIITFKFKSGRIIRKGRGENAYSPISIYVSHSKKEQEWLRASTMYNKIIFEETTSAIDEEEIKMLCASKVGNRLDSLEAPQLLKLAEQNSINIGDSLDVIKRKLLVKLTKEEIAKEMLVEQNRNAIKTEEQIFGK